MYLLWFSETGRENPGGEQLSLDLKLPNYDPHPALESAAKASGTKALAGARAFGANGMHSLKAVLQGAP